MQASEENREVVDGALRILVGANGSSTTMAVSGEVDLANAKTLATELEKLATADASTIVVDLSDLEFIDSTGIAVLVEAHRRLGSREVRLRMVRSRASSVRRVLEITGLDSALPFVDPGETA